MNALGVVEQRDVEVGVERLDLVVIKRGEQPVPPAERGVRVDQHVLVLLGGLEDLLEDRAAERVEPADRQVQNPPRRDVGGLLVHHLADVADLQVDAAFVGQFLDGFEIRPLIDADLTGHDCAHRFSTNCCWDTS